MRMPDNMISSPVTVKAITLQEGSFARETTVKATSPVPRAIPTAAIIRIGSITFSF
jgi:hypothetical protein